MPLCRFEIQVSITDAQRAAIGRLMSPRRTRHFSSAANRAEIKTWAEQILGTALARLEKSLSSE